MRFLSFVFIITLSHFTKGQNVFSKFPKISVQDNFETNNNNLPQKYNSQEISIIENGNYRIKRISNLGRSISYLKMDKELFTYSVSATISIANGTGGGLILNGQSTINGGIFVELNGKKRFRIIKTSGEQVRLLSGKPKDQGWVKSSNINKKGYNELMVRVEDGNYDIYINGKFTYTTFDDQYKSGRVGIVADAASELFVSEFTLMTKADALTSGLSGSGGNDGTQSSNSGDPAFEEVVLIFKTKIDQQQVTINTLQREVDKCKSMLNYDTSLVTRSAYLEQNNRTLSFRLDSTTRELSKSIKRLEYLESMKADIEKGNNGDLVLSLTSILANVKKENAALEAEHKKAQDRNAILKKDNEVLLREIERMKYMLNLKE